MSDAHSRASGERAKDSQRSSVPAVNAGASPGNAHSTAVKGRSNTRSRDGFTPSATCHTSFGS